MVAITADKFRKDFEEFSNDQAYSNSLIENWVSIGGLMLNPARWPSTAGVDGRSLYDLGIELFAAHNIALERMAIKVALRGGIPGLSSGPVSSEGAGGASVSYDTGAGLNPKDGHWNLTVYGTRFISMMRMVGAGPVQVGAACGLPPNSGPAWPGPWGGWLFGQSW